MEVKKEEDKKEYDFKNAKEVTKRIENKGKTHLPEGYKGKFKVVTKGVKKVMSEPTKKEWIRLKRELKKGEAEIKRLKAKPKKIKLPYPTYETTREAFALQRILPKQLTLNFKEGEEMYSYQKESQSGQVKYWLPKEIVNNKIPSLPLMNKAYLTSWGLAVEQQNPLITFTLGEKMKRLGYTEEQMEGKLLKDLERAERGLAGITFDYKGKGTAGKRGIEVIGSLYSYIKTGEGKNAVYEAFLNPIFTKGMDFETGQIKGRYIKTSLEDITGKGHHEKNIRAKVLDFKGISPVRVYGKKILGWSGISEGKLKRKDKREEIYKLVLKVLKEEGYEKTETDYKGKPKDLREWKFTFKRKRGGG